MFAYLISDYSFFSVKNNIYFSSIYYIFVMYVLKHTIGYASISHLHKKISIISFKTIVLEYVGISILTHT